MQIYEYLFVGQLPQETWYKEKTNQYEKVWPERLGAMFEFWYIKRGLLPGQPEKMLAGKWIVFDGQVSHLGEG